MFALFIMSLDCFLLTASCFLCAISKWFSLFIIPCWEIGPPLFLRWSSAQLCLFYFKFLFNFTCLFYIYVLNARRLYKTIGSCLLGNIIHLCLFIVTCLPCCCFNIILFINLANWDFAVRLFLDRGTFLLFSFCWLAETSRSTKSTLCLMCLMY